MRMSDWSSDVCSSDLRADEERHAPAPGRQFGVAEELLHDHQHQHGDELAADQGDILERGEEAAMLGDGDLAHVGGAGAVFAAEIGSASCRERECQYV